jgi:hypothetical protein
MPGAGAPAGKRPERAARLALEYPERQLFGRTVGEDVAALLWVEGVPESEAARPRANGHGIDGSSTPRGSRSAPPSP